MHYYFEKTISGSFEDGVQKTINALKEEDFGIITDIDVKETFRKKLGISFQKYRILGACNPLFAHKALLTEDKIGTMLPCNVIVQEESEGKIQVAAVDPVASMQAVNNSALADIAGQVRHKLKKAIERL